MKSIDKKLLGRVMVGLILLLVILGWGLKTKINWQGDNDLKLGVVVNGRGMGIVSISKNRRMVNTLEVGKETKLWVPEGYGWYNADKIGKLLASEKKMHLMKNVFFFNFSFVPNVIVEVDEMRQWQDMSVWMVKMGMANYFKYRSWASEMLVKDETIGGDLDKASNLGEMLARDFSDNRLVKEEVRVTIVNNSDESGVARWLSNRLEWMGVVVVGLETGESTTDSWCEISGGKTARTTETFDLINKTLICREKEGEGLTDDDIEISLGKDFATMIKY